MGATLTWNQASYGSVLSTEEEVKEFSIVEQSHSTTIIEDNSTVLFGVKVSHTSDSTLHYQWYKDEIKLNDKLQNHKCYGAQQSIICIFVHNFTVEGSYKCDIYCGDSIISTDPAVLTVKTPLDQYRERLNDFYTAKPEIPEDTWPPSNIDSYINLALVKQQGMDNAGEYARCTIRGDADDVFKDKEKIEYNKAFEAVTSGSMLLIEGRPGSGKTTLVHKVSKDWAEGKLTFGHVRLLFLVHLRGFLSDPKIKLQNILECYLDDVNDSSSIGDIIKYASKHNGLGLCFILDGFDEYLPKKRDTYIHKLINKSQLPKAVVIVASRPVAVAEFRPLATRQIEVLGFLKEQIAEYIKTYNFSSKFKCTELLKYLEIQPNVHNMCYLPIHTAMVCFLGQAGRSLPDSETGIYKEFTICFFLRALRKDEEDICIDSVHELPLSDKESYMKICKLAFETTMASKQVIHEKEVKDYFDVFSNKDYLGLINVDKVALRHGFQKLYTFLHLTFQEFLAACHISYLGEEEQAALVRMYGNLKQMQVVWKFYCGLVNFDIYNKNFESLLDKLQYGTLYKVQCSFESQQSSTCDSLAKKGNLSFKDNFFTLSDFTAISFVISNSVQNAVSKLVFDECTLPPEGIELLKEKAGGKLSLIKTLCFHGHNCVTEQLALLNKMMHALPRLEILDITNTQLGEDAVSALTSDIHHPTLQILQIDASESNTLYSSVGLLETLVKSFKSNCHCFFNVWFSDNSKIHLNTTLLQSLPYYLCSIGNLSDINISFRDLQLIEVKVLSIDLQRSSAYSRLSLIGCNVTDDGVKLLSDAIRGSSIEILELNINAIGNEGALSLAEGIKSCFSLHTLNLSCNLIGDAGSLAIAKAIPGDRKDFKFYLWSNDISSHAADVLLHVQHNVVLDSLTINENEIGSSKASVISSCVNHFLEHQKEKASAGAAEFGCLRELNLSNSSICDGSLIEISSVLKKCLHLTSLDLSSNSFGNDGVKALADALSNCTSMTLLNLSSNSITDKGVATLSKTCLSKCKNLSSLNLSRNSIGFNGTEALANALKNCTCLKSLELSHNSISDPGIKELASSLRKCLRLTSINLSHNSFSSCGVKDLAGALKLSSSLTSLDISENSVGDDGLKALAAALKNHSNLLSLKATKIDIGKSGANSIADIIKHCSKIGTLEIGCNDIGENGIKAISKHLKKCLNLHTLSLHLNVFGQNGAEFLAKALKNCMALCRVNIHDTGIGAEGMKVIAGVLKHSSNLQELHIGKNNLNKDGLRALAGALMECSHLQILDISHNSMGKEGAKALADAIKKCLNLKTLEISYNEMGGDGSATLAAALRHCTKLQTLYISHNDLKLVGANSLATYLIPGCSISLSTLDVSYNSINDTGIQSLAEALKQCSNLHTLDFSGNSIGRDGARSLGEAIKCCSRLHTFLISSSDLSSNFRFIAPALKYSSNLHNLDISHNSIATDFVGDLAAIMKCCSKLHSLDIRTTTSMGHMPSPMPLSSAATSPCWT